MSKLKQPWKPIDFSQGVYINADKVESWKMHYSMTIDGTDFELTESQHKTLSAVYSDTLQEGRELERERLVQLFEKRLCFDGYDCDEDRCKTVMAFIELVRGETK